MDPSISGMTFLGASRVDELRSPGIYELKFWDHKQHSALETPPLATVEPEVLIRSSKLEILNLEIGN